MQQGTTGTQGAAAGTDTAAGGEPTDVTAQAGTTGAQEPFVTVPPTGAWRVSDLRGRDVEDAAGENIGEMSDVLVDEQGQVIAVLVGVGGFLGIGEKDVAVSMNALEFGPGKTEGLPRAEDVAASGAAGTPGATSPATGGMAAGGTAGAPAEGATAAEPTTPVVEEDNLPDRVVLRVTREQLEQAPSYEDVEEGDTGGGEAAPEAAGTTAGGQTGAPATAPAQ